MSTPIPAPSSVLEVAGAFLRLGCTSFGGPTAHLGYFRHEFVLRRQWLSERAFTELVALCQFLPGPSSSQVGFCLGLGRAGYGGALAAWLAFTLPSALIMAVVAFLGQRLPQPATLALAHGLALGAVAVVTQAVIGMARAHCPDPYRTGIALGAAGAVLVGGSGVSQLAALGLGALLGLGLRRSLPSAPEPTPWVPVSVRVGVAALAAFIGLLVLLPLLADLTGSHGAALFDAFYRSGALVFGGGHVVLPLLREAFVGPGWIDDARFLAGYGAAQAVPGPLFSFAAFLGAAVRPEPHGVAGAALGIIAIFLPGFLLLLATLPFWAQLRRRPAAVAAIAGANAAVVGVLGAALISPIIATAVLTVSDLAIAAVAVALLVRATLAPITVVGLCACAALALG